MSIHKQRGWFRAKFGPESPMDKIIKKTRQDIQKLDADIAEDEAQQIRLSMELRRVGVNLNAMRERLGYLMSRLGEFTAEHIDFTDDEAHRRSK